jgi:hypothetical protein
VRTEKPFLYVCRRLAKDMRLTFTAEPSLAPPETQVDKATQAHNEAQLQALMSVAVNQALPDEDEEL